MIISQRHERVKSRQTQLGVERARVCEPRGMARSPFELGQGNRGGVGGTLDYEGFPAVQFSDIFCVLRPPSFQRVRIPSKPLTRAETFAQTSRLPSVIYSQTTRRVAEDCDLSSSEEVARLSSDQREARLS